ncbi:hypothetical protein Patl1_09411 [Pistacia atlantica]|uniref:Uncharacterized protein n=1 Tax=Pistacia atlantica TaxID=434234 RepID=A0ACC1AEU8_9ROSI|nr:hypothetical protein Patl1_09411 [Pistacia atlantica]
MTMEVEVISRKCIKPSSPTPLHLRTHKLSLLDQYVPPIYVPMVFYYPNQDTNLSPSDIISQRLQLLKQSLSETLSRFYPFAGKVKDSLSIDCNDEGIYFIEARVQNPLTEFLNQPDLSFINKFLPYHLDWSATPTEGTHVAIVQVTTFSCGGIVIGVYVSHIIADGTALSSFIKSWAATARQNSTEEAAFVCPKFDGSSLFPPTDTYPTEATMMDAVIPFFRTGKCITRRFVFDASAIATLKAKAKSSRVQNPTRVEVVTAFLSKRIMAAFKTKYGFNKPTFVAHAVNLRRRAMPPLSEYCMGNFIWRATTLFTNGEAGLEGLVYLLREAITKVDSDFVKSLEGEQGLTKICNIVKDISGECDEVDFVGLSSWCNLGLYEIDFGWGKPTMGIEAWMTLDEADMGILEVDKELLEYVTLDPSPLGLST